MGKMSLLPSINNKVKKKDLLLSSLGSPSQSQVFFLVESSSSRSLHLRRSASLHHESRPSRRGSSPNQSQARSDSSSVFIFFVVPHASFSVTRQRRLEISSPRPLHFSPSSNKVLGFCNSTRAYSDPWLIPCSAPPSWPSRVVVDQSLAVAAIISRHGLSLSSHFEAARLLPRCCFNDRQASSDDENLGE
ncbi:hypothetical protein Bca52824_017911 [Brassica carinata]|uniref:Uncharacterized protein n=1 Tax=Brassica carinata TaxID=52824 RepID=A0A8X7VNH4_BRACI|nr:hypothetical protein Bca52824_017911 [Brassica carinata]